MLAELKKKMQNNFKRLGETAIAAIPPELPDPIQWGEEFVQFPNSARSRYFRISVAPWLREPITRTIADNSTRITTLMKPVQSGGSTFGELCLLYWVMFGRGFLQYNWSNDKRANERWASRIEGILKACSPVAKKMELIDSRKGEIAFSNVFLRMQGAFTPDNLDSDSVSLQINEEVHSWEPGHLKKARGRLTAVWNYKSVDISNAGIKKDQLDQAFNDGTCQRWEVLCPGCGKYHYMRTRWDDAHPELGGLRYDADGCRTGKFEYNYNKLRSTVHFQMPCGFKIKNDDLPTRRKLSTTGKYSEPRNKNAELSHRSYTYESVAVDYIDWMQLIKDKHDALCARSAGDPAPFRRYCCERECIPYDPEEVPIVNITSTTAGVKKNRDGLPEPKLRLFSLDRQQGETSLGEFPYWWLCIRDFQINEHGRLVSRLVYENKLDTDNEVLTVLDEHKCNRWQGVADSGDDTVHVYLFCLQNGINAIKGGKEEFYSHEGGIKRIFSQERPLHSMLSRPPVYHYLDVNTGQNTVLLPDPREPMFWTYSKAGIRERLYWMRSETIYETPEDVSEDYKAHQDAEERIDRINIDGTHVWRWIQHKKRNDLFVCEAYIAMQVDQAGMIQFQKGEEKK